MLQNQEDSVLFSPLSTTIENSIGVNNHSSISSRETHITKGSQEDRGDAKLPTGQR